MAREEDDAGVPFDDCEVLVETTKALLVKCESNDDFNDKPDGRWIPKSQIHDNSDVSKKGDKGTLVLKTWFANKEGLA